MRRIGRMQTGQDEENRERLTDGPLGFSYGKERETEKRQREGRSKNEREVEKKEVRAVYGGSRVDEIRHFRAPMPGKPFFHGSCAIAEKERAGIRKRTLCDVGDDREARSYGHPLILKMLGEREERHGDGQSGDGGFQETEIPVRQISQKYRGPAPAAAEDAD